jgi:hypothetical protein
MKASLFVKKSDTPLNFRKTPPCTIRVLEREDGNKELRIRYTKGKMISVLLDDSEAGAIAKMLTDAIDKSAVENYRGISEPAFKGNAPFGIKPVAWEEEDTSAGKIHFFIESKMNYTPDTPDSE